MRTGWNLISILVLGVRSLAAVGNSWRTTEDIREEWVSINHNVQINARLWRYAAPGAFNDPDMLEVHSKLFTHYDGLVNQRSLNPSPVLMFCPLTRSAWALR